MKKSIGEKVLEKSIILGVVFLFLSITCLGVQSSSYSSNEELKHPEFYRGLVWGRYTQIERNLLGVEVLCNMGEIRFGYFYDGLWLEFYNIEWLDIYFFVGFARFGVIVGLAVHTFVG